MIFIVLKHHKDYPIASKHCVMLAKLGFKIHIHAVGLSFEEVVVMLLGSVHVSTCELYRIVPGKHPYPHKHPPPNFMVFRGPPCNHPPC